MKQVNIKEYFNQEMQRLRDSRLDAPSLMVIDATSGDAANQIYIRNKVKDFENLGWNAGVHNATSSAGIRILLSRAKSLGYTSAIVQLPVAAHIQFTPDMIPPSLDCDGLNPQSNIVPATARGIIDYLDECGFQYEGTNAVVLGRSDIVGKPMAKELLDRNATVSICHSKTPYYVKKHLLSHADLVVSATGKPLSLHRSECPTAIVVDVGISRVDGKIVGDFIEDQQVLNNCKCLAWSTPVPGGVGLLTRLGLIKNCLELI